MSCKLSYSGGLKSDIESIGETENSKQFNSGGSISQKVERVVYEQALILEALINKATIDDLRAATARIDTLYVKNANIETLLAGNIGADNIAAGAITAGNGIISKGAIGDVEISFLSAVKVNTGTLDTSKVTIAGANGLMTIKGNKLQIFDQKGTQFYERIMLGIDDQNNSALTLRGADGQTVLLNQDGLTKQGFTEGYGKADNDSLDPVKIDIQKVVTRINNGTTTINASKVMLTEKTLDVHFKTLSDTVTAQGQTVNSHTSQLSQMDTEIKAKVSTQTYQTDKQAMENRLTTAEGSITTQAGQISLKANAADVYTKTQVNTELGKKADNSTVTSLTTRITTAEGKIDVQAGQIAQSVTKTEFESLSISGRNLLPNSTWNFSGGLQAFSGVYSRLAPEEDKPNSYILKIAKSTSTTAQFANIPFYERITGLDTYIVSFGIKIENWEAIKNTNSIIFGFRTFADKNLGNSDANSNGSYYIRTSNVPSDYVSGTWIRLWYTVKPRAGADWVRLIPYSGNNNLSDLFYRELQFERATKPSEWNPAPEDTDGQISGIGSRLSTAEATIINQGTEISQRVKTTDFTGNSVASLINQTATTIKIQASKINLVSAVTVLSDITGNLGTITAGTVRGVTVEGGTVRSTDSRTYIKDDLIRSTDNPGVATRNEVVIQRGFFGSDQYANGVRTRTSSFDATGFQFFVGNTLMTSLFNGVMDLSIVNTAGLKLVNPGYQPLTGSGSIFYGNGASGEGFYAFNKTGWVFWG